MIFILLFSILLVDQLSKYTFNRVLYLNQSLPVIKGIFHLTLVHNRGAAFGVLKDKVPLFIITSLIAAVLIWLALSKCNKTPQDKICRVALILILAGGIGNLIDRIALGYVVDFLDFRIWPVFNLADSAITIGAILLGYVILKSSGGN
ncbi:signal peptidase II [bacterium]|nr:MAG: signal peptidase II [bacterium]